MHASLEAFPPPRAGPVARDGIEKQGPHSTGDIMAEQTPDGRYIFTRSFVTTEEGVALYQIYLSDIQGELVRLTYEATQRPEHLRLGLRDLALLLEQGGLEALEGGYAPDAPYLFTRSQDLPVPTGAPRTVRYSAFRVNAPAPSAIDSEVALEAARRQAVGNARSFDVVFHLDRQRDVALALLSMIDIFDAREPGE